jgi:hypothetical protein
MAPTIADISLCFIGKDLSILRLEAEMFCFAFPPLPLLLFVLPGAALPFFDGPLPPLAAAAAAAFSACILSAAAFWAEAFSYANATSFVFRRENP